MEDEWQRAWERGQVRMEEAYRRGVKGITKNRCKKCGRYFYARDGRTPEYCNMWTCGREEYEKILKISTA